MLKKWHILLLLFLGLFILINKVVKRNFLLETKGAIGIAHVYRIDKDVVTAKVGRRDVVHLEYFVSGKRVSFMKDVSNDEILVNTCYEILFLPSDISTVDVYFKRVKECPPEFLN